MKAISRLITEEDGVTAVEYGLLAAVITAGLVASFTSLQGGLFSTYARVVLALNPMALLIWPF